MIAWSGKCGLVELFAMKNASMRLRFRSLVGINGSEE